MDENSLPFLTQETGEEPWDDKKIIKNQAIILYFLRRAILGCSDAFVRQLAEVSPDFGSFDVLQIDCY